MEALFLGGKIALKKTGLGIKLFFLDVSWSHLKYFLGHTSFFSGSQRSCLLKEQRIPPPRTQKRTVKIVETNIIVRTLARGMGKNISGSKIFKKGTFVLALL